MIYENNLEKYLTIITGRTFVKNIAYLENQETLFIAFYSSYKEFKTDNLNRKTSEDAYNQYFTESHIEKILIENSARILMVFPEIKLVSTTLEFKGISYDVNIEREQLNSLTGLQIEELSADDGTWQSKFVNVYTSGVKNNNRKQLLNYFWNEEN